MHQPALSNLKDESAKNKHANCHAFGSWWKNISSTCCKHRPTPNRRHSWGTRYVQLANRSFPGFQIHLFLECGLHVSDCLTTWMQATCKTGYPSSTDGVSTGDKQKSIPVELGQNSSAAFAAPKLPTSCGISASKNKCLKGWLHASMRSPLISL